MSCSFTDQRAIWAQLHKYTAGDGTADVIMLSDDDGDHSMDEAIVAISVEGTDEAMVAVPDMAVPPMYRCRVPLLPNRLLFKIIGVSLTNMPARLGAMNRHEQRNESSIQTNITWMHAWGLDYPIPCLRCIPTLLAQDARMGLNFCPPISSPVPPFQVPLGKAAILMHFGRNSTNFDAFWTEKLQF